MPSNSAACAWCDEMPQKSEPGSAMFAHLRPLERTALQRCIVESSSGSQSSSSSSYSVAWLSGLMSIFQSVSFTARRAFWPSRPIASESWSSGTITSACFSSSSR